MQLRRTSLALALLTPALPAQELVYLLGAEATGGDDFGRAVADAGDFDGDGVPDVLVGAPNDDVNGTNSGSVYVYSGRTGELLWTRAGEFAGDQFGWSVDGLGDINGDGRSDVIVGAPGWDNDGSWNADSGQVWVFAGGTGNPISKWSFNQLTARMGFAVAGLGDIDGDGTNDFAFSTPWEDTGGFTDNGQVLFLSGKTHTSFYARTGSQSGALYGYSLARVVADGPTNSRMIIGAPGVDGAGIERGQIRILNGLGTTLSTKAGSTDYEWFGASVAGIGDANLDGTADYAAGAPYADIVGVGTDAGVVRAYSGATNGSLFFATGATPGANFGASLSGIGDFDGDGRADLVAGAPNDDSGTTDGGEARVVSGLQGLTLSSWTGGVNDHLGRAVSGAGDLNGDGLGDLVLGANDAPFGAGEAYVHLAHLAPPTVYCTAKANSQGCLPWVATQGTPSLTIADDFHVTASDVVNQKFGLLFWGLGPASLPFQGGTLCVQAPLVRGAVQTSGGNPPPDDCSGGFSFHFSQAYMTAQGLHAGDRVHAQYWYRDPASSFTVGLTDAVVFEVVL